MTAKAEIFEMSLSATGTTTIILEFGITLYILNNIHDPLDDFSFRN